MPIRKPVTHFARKDIKNYSLELIQDKGFFHAGYLSEEDYSTQIRILRDFISYWSDRLEPIRRQLKNDAYSRVSKTHTNFRGIEDVIYNINIAKSRLDELLSLRDSDVIVCEDYLFNKEQSKLNRDLGIHAINYNGGILPDHVK